jgi:hypothetical protein
VPAGRVVLISRDLMFGSKVEAMVREAGFECVVSAAVPDSGADDALWVVDLAQGDFEAAEVAGRGVPVLAYYSHVDDDTRIAAKAAGLEALVPRSRMAREGGALIKSTARN